MLIETDSRQPEAGSRPMEHDTRPGNTRDRTSSAASSIWSPLAGTYRSWYQTFKAIADRMAALILLALAAPFLLLAAVLVKLTSPGPAFYTQTRVGRKGRLFTIYKLRTMIDNCESLTGPRWAIPGDPRVTWLGRFLRVTHLDELPQLLNVLYGHMSLIGPRPERPEFVPELDSAIPTYRNRLEVRPGVTGLAQVNLPADTDLDSVRRKLAYDMYYIQNISFWLDLRILLCTALYSVGVPFRFSRKFFRLPCGEAVEQSLSPPMTENPPARPAKTAA
jgi:lipopolysaccharide/colanic/teichoic acid biosynthesis glycosyltransferase